MHMKNESMSRKRSIASMISALPAQAFVYDAGRRHPSERAAREACFQQLVADAAATDATSLLIERDETLVASDRRYLYEATRQTHREGPLRYDHGAASEECLLALPDAVAWCWAKGGDWRRRIDSVVARVCDV